MSNALLHKTSIALNVALVVSVAVLALRTLRHAPGAPTVEIDPEKLTNNVNSGEIPEGRPVLAQQHELPQYADMASGSDRRRLIIDRLRAMGVPNEILGRVARVDFEVEWDSHFDGCGGDMEKLAAVQLEMNASKDAEMRAALGEKDFKEWDQTYMLWEAMSTKVAVSATEAESLYGFKKKLQQRMLELDKARLDGTMDDAEINERVDAAYAEFNQKMKDLLGVERYAKSQQMDDDFSTDSFRHQLAKAKPTDAQFRELFDVEKEWNKARMQVEHQFQNDTFSPDYAEKLMALDAARDQAYQRVLGDDAYHNLRKQQDPVYSQMKKFESLWGLDDEKIDYAYRTMKQYQKAVQDYQVEVLRQQSTSRDLDVDAVNRNLQQITSQTQSALQEQLGQQSFDKLQRNRVLRWATLASSGPRP